ncbi:MAG: hypothetical protein QOF61_437 [Acidobacteriota bacterium]|jgi:hypothetical protein|nr:hypothetical protein [Acidobacteriota bacterium]
MKSRTRLKRHNPTIVIENKATKLVTDDEIEGIIPALQRQVTRHFQPAWGIGAELVFKKGGARIPKNVYRIVVKDRATKEDAGFLGYHIQKSGYPLALIFAEEDLSDDKTISVTLSHEILEMLVDPLLNLYAYRPGKGRHRRERGYFYEVCDAVQCEHYKIDNVVVCNFVYPEWFEYAWPRGSRKFDHRGLLREPFEILKGCYADIYEAGRGARTIWGDRTPLKKRRHRQDARLTMSMF